MLPKPAFPAGCQRLHLRPELAWTRVALGGSSCVQRICRLVTNLVSLVCLRKSHDSCWQLSVHYLKWEQGEVSNLVPERNTKERMPLSRNSVKVWAEDFMWQEHWARSSPAENGCVSTLSKSCSSNAEDGNVSSEDLECIPTNKNIMFLHIILFFPWTALTSGFKQINFYFHTQNLIWYLEKRVHLGPINFALRHIPKKNVHIGSPEDNNAVECS